MSYHVNSKGGMWAVYNLDGERVSLPFRDPESAQKELALWRLRSAPKTRRCMACNADFRSAGPHNRLCLSCRKKSNTDLHLDIVNRP